MFSLQDQVAVVTGGAKGIGRGIAETLADAGATVVIADIDTTSGEATAHAIGAAFEQVDVTSAEACRSLVSRVVDRSGRLDVLCSNTGIYPQATLAVMTEEQWDAMASPSTPSCPATSSPKAFARRATTTYARWRRAFRRARSASLATSGAPSASSPRPRPA